MKDEAINLVDSYDKKKWSLEERKNMAIESTEVCIKALMRRPTYEGIQESFDILNKIKQHIKEIK